MPFPEAAEFDPLYTFQDFLAPRDIAPLPFEWWERGGTALSDVSDGLDVQSWYFSVDSATGIVSVSVPDVIAAATVHTISPLPVQVTGSFDLTMRPVLAWKDVNGDSFVRFWNGASYTVLALPANIENLRLCVDDVREEFVVAGESDNVLAFTKHNSLYVRLGSEDYASDILIQAGGFPTLQQIGMTDELRFQFARTGEQLEGTPNLMYLRPDNRAEQIVGFDSIGQVALYAFVDNGVTGEQGPSSSYTKAVTGSGQTFFLRDEDGVWANSTVTVTLDFYTHDGDALRARRVLVFTRDEHGNITRSTTSVTGEASMRIVEVGQGTRTYTATVTTREAQHGVTFNLLSVSARPTFGEFTPDWNASKDFYGGRLVPTGAIAYADYGPHVVLSAADDSGYTARSITTSLRWGADSLPEVLRPATARSIACTVVNDGVAVAGMAQINVDGSAQFWPLEVSSTRLVAGSFAKSTHVVRQKGLPTNWQVTFAKVSPSLIAPAPVLDSITPSTVDRFDTGIVLTLAGSSFRATSVARLDGVDMTTVYNSSTELEATVPDVALDDATTYDITVFTPTPGGGTSGIEVLTVANPVPTTTSISPTTIAEDSSSFALTVNGTNFVPESVIDFNGTDLTTTYVNSTQLTATVSGTLITTAGAVNVRVETPTPGGGNSNAQVFTIAATDPSWSSVIALYRASTGTLVEHTGIPTSFTITGGGAVSASQFKFGTHSFRNPGTTTANTNYAKINSSSSLRFQFTGAFTWEMWLYTASFIGTANGPLISNSKTLDVTTNLLWTETETVNKRMRVGYWTGVGAFTAINAANNTLSSGVWQHVALTRDGSNVIRGFVDGVQVLSGTRAATFGADLGGGATSLDIMRAFNFAGNSDWNGYWDELRITKGVARYTANFSVPTAPFPTS